MAFILLFIVARITIQWFEWTWMWVFAPQIHAHILVHLFSSFCFGCCCCCCCCGRGYFCCYSCWATIESLVNQPWLLPIQYMLCMYNIMHASRHKREIKRKKAHKSYVHMISIEFYVGFRFEGIHGRAHIFSSYCLLIGLRMCLCVCVWILTEWVNFNTIGILHGWILQ